MKGAEKKSEHRRELYSIGVVVCGLLLFAGFIYQPEPHMTIKDHEADLAIHMYIGENEKAMENIEAILHEEPENTYALLMKAYVVSESGNPLHAIELYQKAYKLIDPTDEMAGKIIDSILALTLKTKNFSEAKRFAEKKIELIGENYASKLIIALSCFSLGDDKGYEENMDRALYVGLLNPSGRVRLDQLIEDKETLQRIYFRCMQHLNRYEERWLGTHWMSH